MREFKASTKVRIYGLIFLAIIVVYILLTMPSQAEATIGNQNLSVVFNESAQGPCGSLGAFWIGLKN